MKWDVYYSAQARLDIRNIYEYIACDLLVPETAVGQTQRIMKKIRLLNNMPMRNQLYSDEPWNSQGLRYMLVDNYLVFYLPNEINHSVNIIRIMYAGRDIEQQLSSTKNDFLT